MGEPSTSRADASPSDFEAREGKYIGNEDHVINADSPEPIPGAGRPGRHEFIQPGPLEPEPDGEEPNLPTQSATLVNSPSDATTTKNTSTTLSPTASGAQASNDAGPGCNDQKIQLPPPQQTIEILRLNRANTKQGKKRRAGGNPSARSSKKQRRIDDVAEPTTSNSIRYAASPSHFSH